jgi:adenylyltransferase/sulfurtransferase
VFRISNAPIDLNATALSSDRAGGYVSFEGRVRNHNEGEPVEALEYEAYEALALAEGRRVVEEALVRFEILEAACVHRVGRLEIGDIAVRVEVAAAHRKEAFRACEYIIDEVKARVPIWKKEHYGSGVTDWVNAHTGASRVREEAIYERQSRLPQVGAEGQARFRRAKVLMVGAGGLGCPAVQYLVAAGVGTVGIADGDTVDLSNLHRQVLYRVGDVGRPKADVAAERLAAMSPFVQVVAHPARVTARNVEELLGAYDVVVDGTDNFRTKFLLNDAAVRAGKPLVTASIYQVEGQVQLVVPGGPCLRCLWPETPAEGCVGTCADVGVLGAVPGVFGAVQAMEVLKLILGLDSPASDHLITYDLTGHQLSRLRRAKNPSCPACGTAKSSQTLEPPAYEVDPAEHPSDFLVVDIREEDEQAADPLPGVVSLPMSRFRAEDVGIDGDRRVLLVCARGARSESLAKRLHQEGRTNFFSLPGGAVEFKKKSPL